MTGIDLNREIGYKKASLRYFAPGEAHVARLCRENVLLLVYEGSLSFTENGYSVTVGAGEYYVQQAGGRQGADRPSDSPKYLYVHFTGVWGEGDGVLPRRGVFSPEALLPLMTRLDEAAHRGRTKAETTGLFLQILTELYRKEGPTGIGEEIAAFLRAEACRKITLKEVANRFHYSKNQVINVMRNTYGVSPMEYRRRQRLKRAEWLLQVTPASLTRIAEECGYGDYSQFYKAFFAAHRCSPG